MSREPSNQLGDDAVAVVVLPSGAVGKHVLEVVRQWYDAGMLRPALWVLPDEVEAFIGAAPRVAAHHLTSRSQEAGDLFELVARHRRQWVRLVLSQVLHRSDVLDHDQLEAGDAVRHWLGESLPLALARAGASSGTELRSVNLVTGVTGLSEMPALLRPMHWDVHVVTSPEDRPDPERANLFVRSADNLVPLSVLSTAVVAGLVPGQQAGPFDRVRGDQSVVFGKALVVRPTVRGLIATGVVDPVAREAAESVLQNGSPAMSEPNRFVLGERGPVVDDLLDWLDRADHGALDASDYAQAESGDTRFAQVGQGFRDAAHFVWRAVVALALAPVTLLRRQAEETATRILVGDQSGIRLVMRPEPSLDFAEQVADLEAAEVERRQQELREIERRTPRMATPELWRDLHLAAHSVLDGGAMPTDAPTPVEGTRRVLLRSPHDVAVDPRDTFEVADGDAVDLAGRHLEAWSPEESRQLARDIQAARHSLESAVQAARTELEMLRAQPPAAEPPAEPDPELVAAHKAAIKSARSKLSSAEAQVARCDALRERFEAWHRRRAEGLTWRLGERVVARHRRAQELEQEARDLAAQTVGFDANSASRLRKQYLVMGWIAIAVAAAYLLVFHTDGIDFWDPEPWTHTALVLVLAAATIVALALWWYRQALALLRRYHRGALGRAHGVALFEQAHGDRRRLRDAYDQLSQWVAMLGWSLHTPWQAEIESAPGSHSARHRSDAVEESDDDPQPDDAVDTGTRVLLPACFQLAHPVIDDHERAVIARQAGGWLAAPGWRGRAWRRLLAHHIAPHGRCDDEEIDALLDRLERDDGRGPDDRARFLEDLEDGASQLRAHDTVLTLLGDHLRETRMCGRDLEVEPVPAIAGHPRLTDREFLEQALVPASPLAREAWSAQALVRGGHEQLSTQCWASVVPRTTHASSFDLSNVDRTALTRSSMLDVSVRVDVSSWRDVADLRLFGSPPADDPTSRFEGDDLDFV